MLVLNILAEQPPAVVLSAPGLLHPLVLTAPTQTLWSMCGLQPQLLKAFSAPFMAAQPHLGLERCWSGPLLSSSDSHESHSLLTWGPE